MSPFWGSVFKSDGISHFIPKMNPKFLSNPSVDIKSYNEEPPKTQLKNKNKVLQEIVLHFRCFLRRYIIMSEWTTKTLLKTRISTAS